MSKVKNKTLSKITQIYIAVMIIFFPLCVDSTGFFKILECKYRYFLTINAIYISSIIITILYYLLFKKENIVKGLKLTKIHYALLSFLIINVISTFTSPYFKTYNLFIGVGRAEGLITIILYGLSFFNITLFGTFRKRYIMYFGISSCLFSLICILQYIGFNPFNMYQDGIGTHNVSFIGTIGNVDFVSAIYCIYLSLMISYYILSKENNKYNTAICLLSIYMGFFIFEVLDVLSGMVALISTLIIFFPYIITNNKKLSKILIVGALVLLGYITNLIINPVYYYELEKIKLDLQFPIYALILSIIAIIFIWLSKLLDSSDFDYSKNKKIIRYMYIGIIVVLFTGIITLFFVDIPIKTVHEIHEILHGNLDDEFGTYRLFLWKRSFSIIKEYPLLGTGADTFAVRFMDKYTQDIAALGELTINDTASNSYITMAVNIGVIGLLSYVIFIVLQIKQVLKNKNDYSIMFFITVICFLIQDFFNLWVVIITPIYWILISVMNLSIEEKKRGW